jgi:PGF-CTERM protein
MEKNPYSVDSDGDGLKDSEDPNPTVPEEKKKTPGFEAVFAIEGILAVAYLLRRRK